MPKSGGLDCTLYYYTLYYTLYCVSHSTCPAVMTENAYAHSLLLTLLLTLLLNLLLTLLLTLLLNLLLNLPLTLLLTLPLNLLLTLLLNNNNAQSSRQSEPIRKDTSGGYLEAIFRPFDTSSETSVPHYIYFIKSLYRRLLRGFRILCGACRLHAGQLTLYCTLYCTLYYTLYYSLYYLLYLCGGLPGTRGPAAGS